MRSRKGERAPLERPWRRVQLIQELARNDRTQKALADKYGVSQASVSAFKDRHRERIEEVRQDLENEFAGMWIADKRKRLEVLMSDVELIEEFLGDIAMWDEDSPQFLRLKKEILKQAADELGQIPQRVNVNVGGRKVTYVIEGVDMEDLK